MENTNMTTTYDDIGDAYAEATNMLRGTVLADEQYDDLREAIAARLWVLLGDGADRR